MPSRSAVGWASAICSRAACARSGGRVRVTAQLIDASHGDHLWAERYDRPLDDIFALQDELVATIAATLVGRIRAAGIDRAKRKPTTDLAAYDLVLRGTERLASYDDGATEAAVALFERAVALDPDYALANAFLALAIFNLPWGERGRRTRRALPRPGVACGPARPDRQPLPPHPRHDPAQRARVRPRRWSTPTAASRSIPTMPTPRSITATF